MAEPVMCWQSCFCSSDFLDIYNVDVLKRPQEVNKQEHHTHLYSSDFLIVRRAQEFQIKITFDRPYKPAEDKFAVEFVIGESDSSKNSGVFEAEKSDMNILPSRGQ